MISKVPFSSSITLFECLLCANHYVRSKSVEREIRNVPAFPVRKRPNLHSPIIKSRILNKIKIE